MAITLSGTNGVTFPSTSVQSDASVGYGQTWQNLTASRTSGTTYTNSTGKTIVVAISTSGTVALSITVGGVLVCSVPSLTASNIVGGNAIVPNGATYVVSCSGISVWAELR
jgi:hypothetical protein